MREHAALAQVKIRYSMIIDAVPGAEIRSTMRSLADGKPITGATLPGAVDVLAFPPTAAQLQDRRERENAEWGELERRARIALFFGVGMFLAWTADVGAAFGIGAVAGSTLFGVASVPLAFIVVIAHVYGRWALDRAADGRAAVDRRYADVAQRDAQPLLEMADRHPAVAQYLRCVGRQRRALQNVEWAALHAWANTYDSANKVAEGPSATQPAGQ